MKLDINRYKDGYSFDIKEGTKCIFSSVTDYNLTSFVQPKYIASWQACADARKLLLKNSQCLMTKHAYDSGSGFAEGEYFTKDISSEQNLEDIIDLNYSKILKDLTQRLELPTLSEKEILHGSLTSFIIELQNLYNNAIKEKNKDKIKVISNLLIKYKRLLKEKFKGKMAEINIQQLQQQVAPKKKADAWFRKKILAQELSDINMQDVTDLLEDYATKICLTSPNLP